jgi:hypothetical protein
MKQKKVMKRFARGDRVYHRTNAEPATVLEPGLIKTRVHWDERDEKEEGVVDTRDLDFADPACRESDPRET